MAEENELQAQSPRGGIRDSWKDDAAALGALVAVPPAVGPQPSNQTIGDLASALVIEPELDRTPDHVPILRGTVPNPALLSDVDRGGGRLQELLGDQPMKTRRTRGRSDSSPGG